MKLGRQWTAIDDLLRDVAQTASLLLAHRDVRLRLVTAATEAELLTDPLAVRGVLRALLVHVGRAAARGDIALRVTSNHYSVRFSFEAPGADRREIGDMCDDAPAATGTFLSLDQAQRLAQLLDGDVVSLQAGATRNLSLILPRTDAAGNALLRSAARPARPTAMCASAA